MTAEADSGEGNEVLPATLSAAEMISAAFFSEMTDRWFAGQSRCSPGDFVILAQPDRL
jgi:hypothetical protein